MNVWQYFESFIEESTNSFNYSYWITCNVPCLTWMYCANVVFALVHLSEKVLWDHHNFMFWLYESIGVGTSTKNYFLKLVWYTTIETFLLFLVFVNFQINHKTICNRICLWWFLYSILINDHACITTSHWKEVFAWCKSFLRLLMIQNLYLFKLRIIYLAGLIY